MIKNMPKNIIMKTLFALSVLITGSVFQLSHASGGKITNLNDFEASRNGEGRVIVTLRAEEQPMENRAESRQRRRDGWLNLNDYISMIQEQAINDLGWQNLNDIIKYKNVPAMALSVDKDKIRQLLNSNHVQAIYKDEKMSPSLSHSLPQIGIKKRSQYRTNGGKGQTIVVIDSGIENSHPFFRGKISTEVCFTSQACPNGGSSMVGPGAARPCENCSHGTHVAGIAAGRSDKIFGVAPDAKIIAIQVFQIFDGHSGAYTSASLRALDWVLQNRNQYNIAAINMSLGGEQSYVGYCDRNSPYNQFLKKLYNVGIATIVASGNDGKSNGVSSPACNSYAISVGSVKGDFTVSNFSNANKYLSLLAPGQGITSSVLHGQFQSMNGTSMATPHVAGAYAVLRSVNNKLTIREMTQILQQTGTQITDPRNGRNYSVIQLDKAMASIRKTARPERPAPTRPKPTPVKTPKPRKPVPTKPTECRMDGILMETEDGSCPQ